MSWRAFGDWCPHLPLYLEKLPELRNCRKAARIARYINSGRRAAENRERYWRIQERAEAMLVLERRLQLAVPDVGSILLTYLHSRCIAAAFLYSLLFDN